MDLEQRASFGVIMRKLHILTNAYKYLCEELPKNHSDKDLQNCYEQLDKAFAAIINEEAKRLT